jgi:hypothetical protein
MVMERYEVYGVKVYQLNICEAIHDHAVKLGDGAAIVIIYRDSYPNRKTRHLPWLDC